MLVNVRQSPIARTTSSSNCRCLPSLPMTKSHPAPSPGSSEAPSGLRQAFLGPLHRHFARNGKCAHPSSLLTFSCDRSHHHRSGMDSRHTSATQRTLDALPDELSQNIPYTSNLTPALLSFHSNTGLRRQNQRTCLAFSTAAMPVGPALESFLQLQNRDQRWFLQATQGPCAMCVNPGEHGFVQHCLKHGSPCWRQRCGCYSTCIYSKDGISYLKFRMQL